MEEEEIVVKPSTEIIPDEYEHFQDGLNQKIHVHIFSLSDNDTQTKVERFKNSLGIENFEIFEHNLEKDNCVDILNGSKCFN